MHIGLNLIFLVPGQTGGMEVATRELLPALAAAAPPGTRFTSFVNRDSGPGPWDEIGDTVIVPVRVARRVEWVRGEQQLLPRLASRAGVELVHSLASTSPAWGRFRRVVTVHDLIYRHHPDAHGGMRSLGMRVLVPMAVRRAHRVIAVSEATRRDLVETLGTPEAKIDVVPQGLGSVRRARPTDERELRARLALDDGRPVLLSLSAKRPHKNLGRLLDALALIDDPPTLVLAGYPTDHERELRAHAQRLGIERLVRWPGWLEDADIEGLWSLTAGFVYPSLHEGFGLPVLEAMARGVPVACADAASLPEVAGGAAALFDPLDTGAISAAVRELLADGPQVARRVERGRLRAAEFTWERTARGTVAAYDRAR